MGQPQPYEHPTRAARSYKQAFLRDCGVDLPAATAPQA